MKNRTSNPWDKLPGETSLAFRAFLAHRNSDPSERKQKDVSAKVGSPLPSIAKWSMEHRWAERTEAWDAHVDEIAQKEFEAGRAKMARRHAMTCETMNVKLLARIESIDPEEIRPADIPRWLDALAKVERLSHGDATERVESNNKNHNTEEVDFSKYTDDELKIMEELAQKGRVEPS